MSLFDSELLARHFLTYEDCSYIVSSYMNYENCFVRNSLRQVKWKHQSCPLAHWLLQYLVVMTWIHRHFCFFTLSKTKFALNQVCQAILENLMIRLIQPLFPRFCVLGQEKGWQNKVGHQSGWACLSSNKCQSDCDNSQFQDFAH